MFEPPSSVVCWKFNQRICGLCQSKERLFPVGRQTAACGEPKPTRRRLVLFTTHNSVLMSCHKMPGNLVRATLLYQHSSTSTAQLHLLAHNQVCGRCSNWTCACGLLALRWPRVASMPLMFNIQCQVKVWSGLVPLAQRTALIPVRRQALRPIYFRPRPARLGLDAPKRRLPSGPVSCSAPETGVQQPQLFNLAAICLQAVKCTVQRRSRSRMSKWNMPAIWLLCF